MAITYGTKQVVHTTKSDAVGDLQEAEILFYMSGTYATADGSKLLALATLIQDSRRNGKTVTLRDISMSQNATKASDGSVMTLKTVAISTADATFKLCGTDYTTEISDAAIPAQSMPFGIKVQFTEA